MSGLSHPATTGKEGVKRDTPGAWALFQAAGSLGMIRKALGTFSLISTQPPAVSASGLKAVKRGGRRGTFPSGARGNKKRDVAKQARLAAGVWGGGLGRRLEPSSRQKRESRPNGLEQSLDSAKAGGLPPVTTSAVQGAAGS